ncbi:hypothetical protein TanjilG_29696 [Lupinus angustifolius]|uniref:GBF-interacting protein 1 N-terminal domain-containing protein n=1 Tax=Lupinus angustifolius TaxID=3871 RepID=A0A4P1R6D7_LUPAN|nr:PREDICTED: GBF-interacting protein 1-like [Lupinus angustifolius]OIW02920.1 hypothetical protein TanjilG_29696 [Lupinus angustifolius]
MSGGGGYSNSMVPIPHNVRNTIHAIREITGKQHTDHEIYAVLRDCSMDPNDTAHKLFYLDTFHEVKRRRDQKEGLSSRASEDSRSKQGGQGRGGRGASGGYSSNFLNGGGRRNHAIRKANGVNHIAEKSHAPSTLPVLLKTKTNTTSQGTRVSAAANQSNVKPGHGSDGQSLVGAVTGILKGSSDSNETDNEENVQPQAAAAAAASPPKTFSLVTGIDHGKSLSSSDQFQSSTSVSGVSGAINREVGSNRISVGPNHVKVNKILHEADDLPASQNGEYGSVNLTSKKNASQKSNKVENNLLLQPSHLSSSSSLNGSSRPSSSFCLQPSLANATEVSTGEASVQSSAEPRQHVTFPNHFQVPKALKSGLTFGSFDTSDPNERFYSGTGGDNNPSALESALGNDESVTSSNQSASLTAQEDHRDYPHSSSYLIEKTPPSEGNSITHSDSNGDQPKPEVLLTPEGHPIQTVLSAQNYGLHFMPTMFGTQQLQFEGSEAQVQEMSHFPYFVSASSQAVSSPSQTPPLQNSIPVSPQTVSVFRPPYSTNFFPYGHYYPPIYMSPMHQFLGHNGFPQQPSAASMYLPAAAAAAAAGIKFPALQFKGEANTGNTAHTGIPSGSFIMPPIGYAASPTANTGSSTGNEDIAVSQLKENQIYTTGQLSEGSAVWIPALGGLGQDISSLQVNSLYNLTPHGHLTFPPTQAGHEAFAGLYQPGQPVTSPLTLLQQSQSVAGPVENVGHPSGSYQQPQSALINWNSNF